MTGQEWTPIRRVLLALDSSGQSTALLESASALAARLDAELYGLFVEDINLLRLAALPFAHEIRFPTATRRRLQNPDVERAMRAQALRAEESLAASAARQQVRWSFQSMRGSVATVMASAALATDLVTVTIAGRTAAQRLAAGGMIEGFVRELSCPLLILPVAANLRAPWVVALNGTPASWRALRLAAQLARRDGGQLIVLLDGSDGADCQRLREASAAELQPQGVVAQWRELAALAPEAIAAQMRMVGSGTLLLPADTTGAMTPALQQLVAQLDCATLLVR